MHVRLTPGYKYKDAIIEAIRRRLEQVPELQFKFSHPSYFSFRTPIEVEISGYSLQTLDLLAEQAVERMRAVQKTLKALPAQRQRDAEANGGPQ